MRVLDAAPIGSNTQCQQWGLPRVFRGSPCDGVLLGEALSAGQPLLAMSTPSSKLQPEFTRRSPTESICMRCFLTIHVKRPDDLANEESFVLRKLASPDHIWSAEKLLA
jgi:hypothetical protein